jgi:hypothetical protein
MWLKEQRKRSSGKGSITWVRSATCGGGTGGRRRGVGGGAESRGGLGGVRSWAACAGAGRLVGRFCLHEVGPSGPDREAETPLQRPMVPVPAHTHSSARAPRMQRQRVPPPCLAVAVENALPLARREARVQLEVDARKVDLPGFGERGLGQRWGGGSALPWAEGPAEQPQRHPAAPRSTPTDNGAPRTLAHAHTHHIALPPPPAPGAGSWCRCGSFWRP